MGRANLLARFSTALTAARQLGPGSIALYGLYRFGLWSGHYCRSTPALGLHRRTRPGQFYIERFLDLPTRNELVTTLGDQAALLIAEADEIARGQVRLYGGPPVPLEIDSLDDTGNLLHWTEYERRKTHWIAGRDIKDLWEPARFGWAYVLGRAYWLTGDEAYAQIFWGTTERFAQANPPYLGPQWVSGQEIALRLMALAFASQVFAESPASTPERMAWLGETLAVHARRIPLTLVYARSQKNNHLITEAAGLFTASLALPGCPQAAAWKETGWRWLNRALLDQIAADGTYAQHSTNYHRLMLHAALWVSALLRFCGERYPPTTFERLEAATRWLANLLDPVSGQVPDLGSNDGANILPLATGDFQDYRPVLQAAGRAFTAAAPFPAGPWDELGLWLNVSREESRESRIVATLDSRLSSLDSWASLRVAHFDSRPAHADQLAVELWWRGLNLAGDAGSYRYNAPPPWENALARTRIHNTIEVDGQDQMRRAGRFLWLDWAQAQIVDREKASDGSWERITARHDGYKRLGVIHQRTLERIGTRQWRITDRLVSPMGDPRAAAVHAARVNWLMPDMDWELSGTTLALLSPFGKVTLHVDVYGTAQVQLIRAGICLAGDGACEPIQGWISPTYGIKVPALAFSVRISGRLPITLVSTWELPEEGG